MSYFMHPVEEDQYVFVACEGAMSGAEAESTRQDVKALLGRRRWSRVMVDLTHLQFHPTAVAVLELSENLCFDLPLETRMALLVNADQTKCRRVVEQMARNRGVTLACFTEAGAAVDWVKARPGK